MILLSDSSGSIYFTKRLAPVLWFGLLFSLAIVALQIKAYKTDPSYVIGLCFLIVFSFVAVKYAVWNLADEVYDCGEHLLVRRGGEEDKIPLSDIKDALASFVTPTRMVLRFTKPRKFGSEIAFQMYRRSSFKLFPWNDLAEELTIRANRARASGNSAPP